MNKLIFKISLVLTYLLIISCTGINHRSKYNDDSGNEENIYSYNSDEVDDYTKNDIETEEYQIEDGIHTATVDYFNPETGYNTTYTLDVEVCDGEVVQINFPNGGYLDDSHIYPTELDDNGFCSVEDDQGRTFDISIDY